METTSTLAQHVLNPASSAERLSLYYLELERLLYRVEHSTTHYQTLGLDRTATDKEVRIAYQQALVLLHPPDEIKTGMPDDVCSRLEEAFEKIYSAFALMMNFGRRVEYDNSLLQRTRPIPIEIPSCLSPLNGHRLAQNAYRLHAPERIDDDSAGRRFEDRRRSDRYSLRISTQVTGFDRLHGMWSDITETVDVSRYGVALRIRRSLQFGAVVHLCLPLPDVLRSHGYLEPDYSVYALVRRVGPTEDGLRKLGLEFIGEEAPTGFSDSPWATFRLGRWDGPERRLEPRADRCEAVAVEYLNDELQHVRQEVAVTENVSCSGARFFLKSAPPDVNFVRIINLDRSFESRATICNRFLGSDGFERLCVRFIDASWPM